jgi:propionyl-CoA carboxylase alpha chain
MTLLTSTRLASSSLVVGVIRKASTKMYLLHRSLDSSLSGKILYPLSTVTSRFQSTSTNNESTTTSNSKKVHLFDKVLIANRGEIAERVIRTCRALDIKSVAVYSTADSNAPFVHAADEAICIGPPNANESYLNMDNVLHAIQVSGAQAVHPGYGFFSENARFCEAVENLGVKFLGPPVHAIEQLGDKLQSKKLALSANVDTIPGYDDGPVETIDHALHLCHNVVPYPVLLKAANGGGGKGMRVCYNDTDLREAWTVAKGEALKFFGDDRLLLEKFVERPHHIEFQIMAATNSTTNETDVVVFPERECSIQRRNQKVIEESPSVLLKQDTRLRMADQVRRLCKVVGYQSAGTVEFLVDENQNFFFLEMNTRLQVEHPVTEAITGTDLVEAMLYVGAGLGLPESMRPYAEPGTIVPYQGHAMEARVYAEDPLRGFLPSTGPLTQYIEPTSDTVPLHNNRYPRNPPYVRMDSGVAPGHNVSPYYDPMLCKLVYYGKDRAATIAGLSRALDEYVIEGVQHNARLVQSVLREPDFQMGATPTSFLPKHYPDGFHGVVLSDKEKEEFAAAAVVIGLERRRLLQQPTLTGLSGDNAIDDAIIVRLGGQFGAAYRVAQAGPTIMVETLDDDGKPTGPGRVVKLDSDVQYEPTKFLATITLDGTTRVIQVLREDVTGEIKMQMYGSDTKILLQSPREYELSRLYIHKPVIADTANMVLSPMPGLLISYAVKPGDTVVDGQELCIVESMKMQNMIRSPRNGTIASCKVAVGASMKVDEVILTFETA